MTQVLHPGHHPPLRLVVCDGGPSVVEARARKAVENENRRAARLAYEKAAEHDVRRVLAMKASDVLEGGRAAILPPHRRRELSRTGERMGLRPFEINLVIAVVQDGARRGEVIECEDVQRSLEVIPGPPPGTMGETTDPWAWARLWLASVALGSLLMMFLIEWVMSR